MAEPGTALVNSDDDEPIAETVLRDELNRLEDAQGGYYSVHLHLSKLRPGNRKGHYIRIAARSFETLIESHDVKLFQLSNDDFVLVCREVPVEEIDPPIYKVRALFSEDPLTAGEDGSLEDRFTTWYDLSQKRDYAAFAALIEEMGEEEEKRRNKKAADRAAGEAMAMHGEPLDPGNLAEINDILEGVRIADLIRQQTALKIIPGGKGEVLFLEHYVSMFELQKRIAPNVNLFGSPWLFQFLTETLDRRMLAVVARWDYQDLIKSFSLNLNVSTILAREFQHFHNKVGVNTAKVVIELQMIDIFSDLSAYFYARDMLQDSGYRVLIDGLNPLSLQFFDPSLLDADYVKIGWSREFLGEVPLDRMVEMREVMKQTGKDKVVMARVDSDAAVQWGLNLGITRYQGHYIDKLVEALIGKGFI